MTTEGHTILLIDDPSLGTVFDKTRQQARIILPKSPLMWSGRRLAAAARHLPPQCSPYRTRPVERTRDEGVQRKLHEISLKTWYCQPTDPTRAYEDPGRKSAKKNGGSLTTCTALASVLVVSFHSFTTGGASPSELDIHLFERGERGSLLPDVGLVHFVRDNDQLFVDGHLKLNRCSEGGRALVNKFSHE